MRNKSSVRLRDCRNSAGIDACDMKQGMLINDTTDPKLTVILNNDVSDAIVLEASTEPVVKENKLPPFFACFLLISNPGSEGKPG